MVDKIDALSVPLTITLSGWQHSEMYYLNNNPESLEHKF